MAHEQRTLPDLPLASGHWDRCADERTRSDLLASALADAATRVLALRGDTLPVQGSRLAWRSPNPADAVGLVAFLGRTGPGGDSGAARLLVTETGGADEPGEWATLRQCGAHLNSLDAGLAATAVALANWHGAHGFCARCGAPTEVALSGWIRRCPRDGSEHYPRTDPAVIMAVVDPDDRLLLARGRGFRSQGVSVLAGFLEPGESLAAAVRREVREEVGVEVGEVTYLGDQPWPFPSSLMVGFEARALTTALRLQADEIEHARWWSREELSAAVASGEVLLSPRVSIARRLIERWYGSEFDVPDQPLRA